MAEINPKRAKKKNSSGTLLAVLYTMCTLAVFVFIGLVAFHIVVQRRASENLTADQRPAVSDGNLQGDQNSGISGDGGGQISARAETEAPVQVQTQAPTEAPAQQTQAPTEAPVPQTQAPTEAPVPQTQALTEAPAQQQPSPAAAAAVSGLFKDGSADPDGYILPQSDSQYLTEADLSNLTVKGVCYAKNEIYARHGRKFLAEELQKYFGKQTWYSGTLEAGEETDQKIVDIMNEYEKSNKDFLAQAETLLGGYSFGS